jgi:hypothetical protein
MRHRKILVRAVTRLAQFDFRSTLKTWVYRVAVNYILDVEKSPVEHLRLTFQRFADDLVDGLSSRGPAESERSLLVEEVKIGCTLGMLRCLDRPHPFTLSAEFTMPSDTPRQRASEDGQGRKSSRVEAGVRIPRTATSLSPDAFQAQRRRRAVHGSRQAWNPFGQA